MWSVGASALHLLIGRPPFGKPDDKIYARSATAYAARGLRLHLDIAQL